MGSFWSPRLRGRDFVPADQEIVFLALRPAHIANISFGKRRTLTKAVLSCWHALKLDFYSSSSNIFKGSRVMCKLQLVVYNGNDYVVI